MSSIRRFGLPAALLAALLMAFGFSAGLLDLIPDDGQTLVKDSVEDDAVAKELPALAAELVAPLASADDFWVTDAVEDLPEPCWTEFSPSIRSPRPPPQTRS